MKVHLQANVTMVAAAGSGASSSGGPSVQGADADLPASSSFHGMLKQMASTPQDQTAGNESSSRTKPSPDLPTQAPAAKSGTNYSPTTAAVAAKNTQKAADGNSVADKQNSSAETAGESGKTSKAPKEAKNGKSGSNGQALYVAAALVPVPAPESSAMAIPPVTPRTEARGRGTSVDDSTTGAAAAGAAVVTTVAASAGALANASTVAETMMTTAGPATASTTVKDNDPGRNTITKAAASAAAPPVAANAESVNESEPSRSHADKSGTDQTKETTTFLSGQEKAAPASRADVKGAAAAMAVAAATAVAPLHRVADGETDTLQNSRSQAVAQPVMHPSNAEPTQSTSGTQGAGTIAANANGTAVVQAPAGADAAANGGSDGHSPGGYAGSGSSNGNRGRALNATANNKTEPGSGSSVSAQGTAANKTGTQETAPNPVITALNGAGGAATLASNPAVHAAHAGESPSNGFGSAAVVARRDAEVSNAVGLPAGAGASMAAVRDARLIGKAGQAEMHIQMETDQLGPLELRAWSAGNRVATTIAAAHQETHSLLSNGVGSLHQALSDHNLQVERIDIVWNSASNAGGQTGHSAAGRGGSGGNQQGSPQPWSATAPVAMNVAAAEETITSSGVDLHLEGRLSVHV